MYTGCWPAKLVNIQKSKPKDKVRETVTKCKQEDDNDNQDSGYKSIDKSGGDNLVYNNPDLWINPNNTDYDDTHIGDNEKLIQEYKALCYKDVHLWIVQNPTPGEHDLLAMEITLLYYKGANRKPKLYILNNFSFSC